LVVILFPIRAKEDGMQDTIGVLAKLPAHLQYLISPALRYGIHQFDDDVATFLASATDAALSELRDVKDKINREAHGREIDGFIDLYPITRHPETAKLYFLLALLDAVASDESDEEWNSVDQHMAELQQHGSYRLASERMWAARFLGELGSDARRAIPLLQSSLRDEDIRVRVWAHFALAMIEGDAQAHKTELERILGMYGEPSSEEEKRVQSECRAALARLSSGKKTGKKTGGEENGTF
jgi:hypothetical protein